MNKRFLIRYYDEEAIYGFTEVYVNTLFQALSLVKAKWKKLIFITIWKW